jgi:hypothetical protein
LILSLSRERAGVRAKKKLGKVEEADSKLKNTK